MKRRPKRNGSHAHGCTSCGLRYADACASSDTNGVCESCRTGRPRLASGFDPAPCCATDSRQIRDLDTAARYGLGGDGDWWQCATCYRTHPYPPAEPPRPAPTREVPRAPTRNQTPTQTPNRPTKAL